MEWFDWLPIFSEPMSQSFISQEVLNDRFFSLISFAHVTVPLIILFVLWIHIMRISKPVVNPRRALVLGMLLALLILALVKPVLSQGPADMGIEPGKVEIDWFYLFIYPLLDIWPAGQVWALVIGVSLLFCVLPWLPSRHKQIPVAEVNLKECSGCRLCVADCPYEAVVMRPRSDGMQFMEEAVVVADRCVSCGICVGACPSSSAFRGVGYVSGIEMPSLPISGLRTAMMNELAKLEGDVRIMVFGCDMAANIEKLRSECVAVLSLPCIAMLPPSFIEYALHEHHVEGVLITGCRENDCYHRLGVLWTERRLTAEREPRLRSRADRERIRQFWAASADFRELESELESFRTSLQRGSGG
jgi:ferredoxin/coenzyme F420-reducing hydrogenase delta subunit